MTERCHVERTTISRVSHRRGLGQVTSHPARRDFDVNERVRSLAEVKNDGTYPHKDIGEVLVHQGDVGRVHESWSFLGDIYYTIEFFERAVVVLMRDSELAKADLTAA
ncbi:nitrogen fixation protein NifZ [Microbacteriaceae bacterium K1510]|nr:nitrogen fixation protein NifZ [Microbacteriaceae bacterium K1510]